MTEQIHVVAGVLSDADGRVLLAQRLPGKHMAGRWEFPGGKLQSCESPSAGLARELHEELGVTVKKSTALIRVRHAYPDREVLLDVWRVADYAGQPVGTEGQALRWIHVCELHDTDLLEADKPIVDALNLPDRYAITPTPGDGLAAFSAQIARVTAAGDCMLQLRAPGVNSRRLHELAVAAVQVARGCPVLINGDPSVTIPLALATGARGVHVPYRYVDQFSRRAVPAGFLVGASCHDLAELEAAAESGANFAVLGPVLPTPSHPGATTLGWDKYAALVDQANLPVYALGGVELADIALARSLGSQGVAGIRAFFD